MTTTIPPQPPQPPRAAVSWREAALARSEIITDAWEVTKTYAGRIAEWVLFGCMVANIVEIVASVPTAVSNIVMGTQVVMLDVGGFSLATMGEQAHEQGDDRAARKAARTGYFLIGVTILTLLLVTVGLLWSPAKPYTDMAEKGLILVRVVMTVIYAHVIHSLRRATAHTQHATLTEQITEFSQRLTESEQRMTELVQRTANRLSGQFTEHLERTVSEHPTHTELANISETVEAHTRTLTELAALPASCEQLQQELQELQAAMREANSEQRKTEHVERTVPNSERPKLSVVEPNTEHRTAKDRTRRANSTESDKGAFVRECLIDTPNMRNADIQRKASEQGITISPAYISEIRKAFSRERTA